MRENKKPLRTGPLYLVMMLFVCILIAFLTHVILATHYWSNHELQLKLILSQDMEILSSISSKSSFELIQKSSAFGYNILFESSGFNEMIRVFSSEVSLRPIDTEMRKLIVYFWPEIQAAMYSVQIIGERLATLFLSLPLFGVAFVVAASDGWAGRWLRREYGGRESAFLYHRLKRAFFLCVVLLWAIYLIVPYSFDPRILIITFVVLFAVLLRFTIVYFKKYF